MDLSGFEKRITALKVNITDVKRADITGFSTTLELPNRPGKQNSLKLFIYLSKKNNGKINKVQAASGLNIYGLELIRDAKKNPGKHPAIDLLQETVKGKSGSLLVNIVKHSSVEVLSSEKQNIFKKIYQKFGTPVYAYFEGELKENMKKFLDIPAPYGLTVRFAIKANPTAAILSLYKKMGAHFDASTINECIRAMKAAGIPGEKIRLTSQEVQTKESLNFISKNKIIYTACSLLQLETYGKALPDSNVSVRFNIGIGSGWTPQTSTGGKNSPFGIYEQREEISALLKKYRLNLNTVHLHIGSGSDPEKQKLAIIEGLRLVKDYPTVTTLNMGGGFKVAGMSYEHAADIKEMGRAMSGALKNFYKETGRKIVLEIEPGTALVAKSGYVLTEIIDKVNTGSAGEEFLKVNAGMNMNARIPMYGAQHPLIVIPRIATKKIKEYVVFGVCCESGDVLTVRPGNPEYIDPRRMIEASVGDLLVVGRGGAYCSSMAPGNYNSQPLHPEILVRQNGKLDEIRSRQPIEDMWKYEKVPQDLKK